MLMQKIFKGKRMPFWYWKLTQYLKNKLFGNKSNTLKPTKEALEKLFDPSLLVPELKNVVEIDPSNQWTLDAEVLNYLWIILNKNKPKVILEFGSGTSTKLFFNYFKKHSSLKFRLITIEQDADYLENTKNSLSTCPENTAFHPLHFNINENGFLIDHEILSSVLKQEKIDFILIDAPYGGWMARKETLPSVIDFTKIGTFWLLDDAFRDSEMEILRSWRRSSKIDLQGIIYIGKGLGIGKIKL